MAGSSRNASVKDSSFSLFTEGTRKLARVLVVLQQVRPFPESQPPRCSRAFQELFTNPSGPSPSVSGREMVLPSQAFGVRCIQVGYAPGGVPSGNQLLVGFPGSCKVRVMISREAYSVSVKQRNQVEKPRKSSLS